MKRVLKRLSPYAIIVAAAFLLLYIPDIGPERYSDLATFCRVESSRQGIPGFAIAAVSDGAVLYVDGFGVDGKGAPIGPDTALFAAAAAPSFAALSAYSLSASGSLRLDAPVSEYLPWFSFVRRDVTIRQLLAHASGYSAWGFDDAHPSAPDLQSAARSMLGARPSSAPGASFHYIDTGYQALALAMEAAAGKGYSAIVRERVFLPLGMKSSDVRPIARPPSGSAPFFSMPVPRPAPSSVFGAASGFATCSASDMGQYMSFLLAPQKFARGPVDAQAASALFEPLLPTSSHGYGLFLSTSGGKRMAYHDGMLDGFSSRIALWPDQRTGIAVLSAQGSLIQSRFSLPAMTETARRIVAEGSSKRPFPLGRLYILLAVAAAVNVVVLAFQIGVARRWAKIVKDRAEAKGSRGPLRFATLRTFVGIAARAGIAALFPLAMGLAFEGRILSWSVLFQLEPGIASWCLFSCLLGALRNAARLAWLREWAFPRRIRGKILAVL